MSDQKAKRMWAVMTAQPWSAFTAGGLEITGPEEGPHKFMPLFDTREQAVAWSLSGDKHVVEVELNHEIGP